MGKITRLPETVNGKRMYGIGWRGSENPLLIGEEEDINRCIAMIKPRDEPNPSDWQCRRKRGFGKDRLFCKQHAKGKIEKGNETYCLSRYEAGEKGCKRAKVCMGCLDCNWDVSSGGETDYCSWDGESEIKNIGE